MPLTLTIIKGGNQFIRTVYLNEHETLLNINT